MSIQTSPEQALSKFDETDLAEFQRLKMKHKGDERAAVQDFITGLEGDIESARKQLMDMGYDVGLPARQEGAISGLPQVSGTYPPLETTSAPSAAPVLGAISAPDGAVATAVTNKPASQRFWETKPRPPEAVTGEDYLGPEEVAMPVDDSLPPDQVRAPQ